MCTKFILLTKLILAYSPYQETTQSFHPTEVACRYAGAIKEVDLRQTYSIDTSKKFNFECICVEER